MSERWRDLRKCERCGIPRRVCPGRDYPPICRDCLMVARDLGELELWLGRAA